MNSNYINEIELVLNILTMKNYQRIKGLIAATFTPMDVNGKINVNLIKAYAKHIEDLGISGVLVCGTTGEFASLLTDERKMILEKWVEVAKGKFKVFAHVGSNSQREGMILAEHASQIGADGIAALSPSFFKPTSVTELADFFEPIAKGAKDLPFYYYHIPSMTGVHLPVLDFLREGKKKMPNLVGVKYTDNNFMEMVECLHYHESEFEVLHGFDEMLLCGIALGAEAAVGSTYNYAADVYLNLIESAKMGDIESAREYQMKSIEIVKIVMKYGGGVRGGKAIMNLKGLDCGSCRLPLKPFTKEEYGLMKNDLKKISFPIK